MVPVSTTETIRLAVTLLLLSLREHGSPCPDFFGHPDKSSTAAQRNEPVRPDRLRPPTEPETTKVTFNFSTFGVLLHTRDRWPTGAVAEGGRVRWLAGSGTGAGDERFAGGRREIYAAPAAAGGSAAEISARFQTVRFAFCSFRRVELCATSSYSSSRRVSSPRTICQNPC